MLILFLLILPLISADNNNTSIIYIHEELPPNTLLLQSISSTNSLQWLPSSYLYRIYFNLNQNQSLYTTNQRLDREELCERNLCNCTYCVLTLNFLQTFSTNNISIRTIQIVIEDINDHAPTFKQSFIKLSIAENVPIGYEIPLESAIDNDYGLYSIQNYKLHPIINNPFRLIQTNKPVLKLMEPLDRELKSNYLLQLIADDGGSTPLSGQQKIEIIITDVNDHPPVFDRTIYQQSIPENNKINTVILQIHANDRDENENARLSYSIEDSSSTFRINEHTGELYLIKPLDYERIRSYSISITAHDHGTPQLSNYAQLIIDITDINDNSPSILITNINGSHYDSQPISLSECAPKGTSLFYIYANDEDTNENGRIRCSVNDTRLNLVYLTLNAYSLQITGSPSFDYETEQFVINIELTCKDDGHPSLSKTVLFHILLEDCNDNPPDIISSIPYNETILISYETTETPFIITQFEIEDRDLFQLNLFSYSFTVTPSLDLSLTNNGTLILRTMPLNLGSYIVNVTVADSGNLTNTISIPINIYSINETMSLRKLRMENISLVLVLSFFIIIFIASITIGICFLIGFLFQRKKKSPCLCCYSCFNIQQKSIRNSSCESMNSSNERADSLQKTTIEVLDDGVNSSNRIYQYGLKEANDLKVVNTRGIDRGDFSYSEKVERYLTHLNNGIVGIDANYSDDGVYGSSDLSSDRIQKFSIRPPSIISIPSSQQHYQDSLKRFEQLYSFVEHRQQAAFTSDSLYV
ncbi:unnamed protein product [Rotaria socialis]|uniref:Cadherin domain-containing protein n=1 Tax=Rotaria socialis TaxID=392032 RepID=A0A818LVF2_9BILA|nr:unnamed protein product [Rotaria socialis]CAF3327033.1 unnamed protein product [Rotaria socialis]CAF3332677.1 unnamed protein product [Rotaria socialis]CAF3356595.1 unnamed protein product [Rotaria socialis]CAF3578101.1 unnamed protein product [Rotaria socialis]